MRVSVCDSLDWLNPTHHQGGTLNLGETGVVLDLIGSGQLTASGDSKCEETFV